MKFQQRIISDDWSGIVLLQENMIISTRGSDSSDSTREFMILEH
jgi:hypothetical protein